MLGAWLKVLDGAGGNHFLNINHVVRVYSQHDGRASIIMSDGIEIHLSASYTDVIRDMETARSK